MKPYFKKRYVLGEGKPYVGAYSVALSEAPRFQWKCVKLKFSGEKIWNDGYVPYYRLVLERVK